jgi:hypothetical protein
MVTVLFFPLALLVLGGVAIVAFLVVKAITSKGPGSAAAAVLGLLALVLGVGLVGGLASVFFPAMHRVKAQSMNTMNHGVQMSVPAAGWGWLGWLLLSVVILAVLLALLRHHRRTGYHGERGGWGLPLLVMVVLVLVGANMYSLSRDRAAERWRQASDFQPDVDQLWERTNQPKIDVVPNLPLQVHLPNLATTSATPPPTPAGMSPETARLLANMVVQIDVLAHQVAAIAREASQPSGTADDTAAQSGGAQTAADGGITAPARPVSVSLALKVADAAVAVAKSQTGSASATTDAAAAAAAEAPTADAAAASAAMATDDGEPAGGSRAPTRSVGRARPQPPVEGQPPAEPRPDWVDDPPRRVGNIWREVVAAGEYETDDECIRAADVYLLLATYDRVMQLTGNSQVTSRTHPSLVLQTDSVLSAGRYLVMDGRPVDPRLKELAQMGVDINYIRREIAKKEYVGTAQRSFGPMKTLYTLVEFSPSVDHELKFRWEAYERTERFAVVGGIAGLVLGVVGFAYGLLKVDTWTKGYYTKRLFLGVPAVIIGLVALVVLLGSI